MPCPGRWKQFRRTCSKIHLVDKCLIVFMAILLIQSAYMLFVPLPNNSDATYIDVIIRTSAAAIFGYFLSANFITHASLRSSPPQQSPSLRQSDTPPSATGAKSKVGFAVESETTASPLEDGAASPLPPQAEEEILTTGNRLQILVAAGIGLFSLVALLLIRDLSVYFPMTPSDSAAATVAQLRDFVSGCVGFLIGSPTGQKTTTGE